MKILVALDPAAPNDDAFAALHALLRGERDLEVCGLFVENDDLLRYSSLPIARQVCVSSRVVEQLSIDSVEAQIRARAARVQATFEVAVRQLHGRARFDIRRGGVLEELRAAARDCDLLVIARSAGAGRRPWFGVPIDALLAAPPCSLLFVQEPWATGTSVLVTSIDDSKPLPEVAQLGARLADSERLRLVELDFTTSVDSDAAEFAAMPILDTDNLDRACERLRARALVLPDTPAVRARLDLGQLVSHVGASVLLVVP